MKIQFHKYQGAGNDFVMIDNRDENLSATDEKSIRFLCNRKFGIGADGLIFIQNSDKADFEMVYFNSNGKIGSMCGNGARCAVMYAARLDIVKGMQTTFYAYDGIHKGIIEKSGRVKVTMGDVKKIEVKAGRYILDTGSPHYVTFVKDISEINVKEEGRKIRYNKTYKEKGINVNFAELSKEGDIAMRTYERGVEKETLSCGTGTVAVAIAVSLKKKNNQPEQSYTIQATGGTLNVSFEKVKTIFKNIWLEGPAEKVFEGELEV